MKPLRPKRVVASRLSTFLRYSPVFFPGASRTWHISAGLPRYLQAQCLRTGLPILDFPGYRIVREGMWEARKVLEGHHPDSCVRVNVEQANRDRRRSN